VTYFVSFIYLLRLCIRKPLMLSYLLNVTYVFFLHKYCILFTNKYSFVLRPCLVVAESVWSATRQRLFADESSSLLVLTHDINSTTQPVPSYYMYRNHYVC